MLLLEEKSRRLGGCIRLWLEGREEDEREVAGRLSDTPTL